ncbi:hypothetical protein V1J52_11870 [Streptomyces sp. TRM 70351]|uniref:hypothetical protein n=1 Tax=Streptomyces sp. TRM 70351 TaxID=3116552 RepID=UPI002E7AF0F5|nr:hypothetical protein [Streptomyces sp. TRM 70351]MEE1928866.1 hypothetical protein [Streptomyces sp. TRM 70351]
MNPPLRALSDGELVDVPSTVDEIRAAVQPTQSEAFERELGGATFHALPRLLLHWAIQAAGAEAGTPSAPVATSAEITPFG